MTSTTPYSLKPDSANSDAYYQTIADFADRWLESARIAVGKPVHYFQGFLDGRALASHQDPVERSFEESAFEMLVLGVLLREHGEQALKMPLAPAWMLARLVETQDRIPLPVVEKPVKAMRGIVQGLIASGARNSEAVDFERLPTDDSAAAVVHRLVTWLRAEGLNAQADRMADWRDFMARLEEQSAQAILARCLLLAEEFTAESLAALGRYTERVTDFVTCAQMNARWRYDAELVTRTRVEYHLGMLGTEILSRAYRERYEAAPRKIVIVPDCLCAHSRRVDAADAPRCQAERTPLGGKCQGCTLGCKVRTLTRLGEQRGFEVYILPDDLRGIGLGSCSSLRGVGVVGVSCALTNWDAGWQIHDAGVPAQGLLLDFPGCRSHWSQRGTPTDVNLKKLLDVVGEKIKMS